MSLEKVLLYTLALLKSVPRKTESLETAIHYTNWSTCNDPLPCKVELSELLHPYKLHPVGCFLRYKLQML